MQSPFRLENANMANTFCLTELLTDLFFLRRAWRSVSPYVRGALIHADPFMLPLGVRTGLVKLFVVVDCRCEILRQNCCS